jgi:F-type H+-transporting ATPase subunit b
MAALAMLALCAPELLASSEGGGEGGYSAAKWKDFGLRCLNFVVFAAILYFLLRKLVRDFFRGKREEIARKLEYLETQAKNAEEQDQVMKRRLSELAQEREGILAQYERDGQRERDRIIAEANETAAQIVRKAQTAVGQELKQAKRQLAQETGSLAVGMAGDLIAKNITDDDKAALVGDFMDQLTKLGGDRKPAG